MMQVGRQLPAPLENLQNLPIILSLAIGLISPPVGVVLFILMKIGNIRLTPLMHCRFGSSRRSRCQFRLARMQTEPCRTALGFRQQDALPRPDRDGWRVLRRAGCAWAGRRSERDGAAENAIRILGAAAPPPSRWVIHQLVASGGYVQAAADGRESDDATKRFSISLMNGCGASHPP
ncbi:hypothetical protein RHAB21_04095 [Pseudorhizobium halotolerans]|uniref:Uncharacterized protein n=1 Tax=Pseudorhizobium halotolerans TaxID=1233081 RepID=A0ABN7JV60_9HYPH|nr:hypothetical protein RHAB21_04095 [Pseudorhizobium halotolerans]